MSRMNKKHCHFGEILARDYGLDLASSQFSTLYRFSSIKVKKGEERGTLRRLF
jgi:hypothetical protein